MDEHEEIKRLLKENLALSRENHQILTGMRRSARISRVVSIFYWILILGVPIWLYFSYVKPYVEEMQTTYRDAQARIEGLPDMPDFGAFLPFLEGGSAEE